jgi:transcriptional regulator with XRE-family HTH domain
MDMVREHGWTLAHWGRIERGVADARISTLERVAHDLGVSLSELFADL